MPPAMLTAGANAAATIPLSSEGCTRLRAFGNYELAVSVRMLSAGRRLVCFGCVSSDPCTSSDSQSFLSGDRVGPSYGSRYVASRKNANSVCNVRIGKATRSRLKRVRNGNTRAAARYGNWASSVVRADQKFLESTPDVRNVASETSLIVNELRESEIGEVSSKDGEKKQSNIGVFPGGVRRAEVRIPGLVLRLQVLEVLEGRGLDGFLSVLSSLVAEGLTMVIIESGTDGGGARLYEAACLLKSVLRGRAELLVAERVDIAAAAGADGVVLSDDGLPTVVARRMMQTAGSESAVLPLVARTVASAQSAKDATALEGADLLILQCLDEDDVGAYVKSVCNELRIPIFVDLSTCFSPSVDTVKDLATELLQAGGGGVILAGNDWRDGRCVASLSTSMTQILKQSSREPEGQTPDTYLPLLDKGEVETAGVEKLASFRVDTPPVLEELAKLIVEEERELLTVMIDFVKAATPEMEEISLLVDALKQLDELFLLVVVGEFNSGKSSVINALLGDRFLKEGVLPTTNEITMIRHSEEGSEGEERSEKHPDGHFLRYLPAELLKQMNLVDTPGTNVILQRQQRLTEEFVPRADLVLFVLSVDRPLTESEVTFLRYIRNWGKKIIFILNKADVLSNSKELEDVMKFVKENAQSLLSVEEAVVYPVSARLALLAKLEAVKENGILDKDVLIQNPRWDCSGFQVLEDFIFSFLGGSSDAGAERLRLKLDTPLGIGMALLSATERQLGSDLAKADLDLKVVDQIEEQFDKYQSAVQSDSALQRERTSMTIGRAKQRAEKLVDSILRLSNVDAMLRYLLGGDKGQSLPVSSQFDSQVIGTAKTEIQKIIEEHGSWMVANTSRQLDIYRELINSRWSKISIDTLARSSSDVKVSDEFQEERQRNSSNSVAVLQGFDVKSAEILLDQEIREAVLNTFTGVGAAGLSASVLTSILPTTLEDLVALGICTAGGFVGIKNLPAKRQNIKKKIRKVADNLAKQMEEAMEKDLRQNLEQLRTDLLNLTTPYRLAAEEERSRVFDLTRQLEKLDSRLRFLRQKVQNLGT